ncbi:hypothetical protein BJ508DRAFT_365249 [Ascobolus immersus RN42]|uniref:Uncharacterized protein n=1 Tax=Ascobolus immersus RN42 TaxID=1160509 RepID=A0A3N4HU57_ASCIM|nr:hypothetical protein BJ508DRAFT_365249 [Ascobolus immersus RN42]
MSSDTSEASYACLPNSENLYFVFLGHTSPAKHLETVKAEIEKLGGLTFQVLELSRAIFFYLDEELAAKVRDGRLECSRFIRDFSREEQDLELPYFDGQWTADYSDDDP